MARMPCRRSYRDELLEAMAEVLPPYLFSRFFVHGNADWTPQKLAWMSVLMSWDEAPTLGARFQNCLALLKSLHPRWKLPSSYSGYIQALQQHTPMLREMLITHLRPDAGWATFWRVHGWLAVAVDGSRFESPRTVANEQTLECAGNERSSPQVFQTTLLHVGTGLPWDFRLGPGTDSERRHLDDMLSALPAQSLLMADAGFVSFDLCTWLCSKGYFFLLRVGANIRLLTSLGWEHEVDGQTVYLWSQARRNKPPLVLRLIKICNAGKLPVYLLTNILDKEKLSDETAGILYRLRWGIEVYYRTDKQTFAHRRLLSHSPHAALLERNWGVLGLWVLQLIAIRAVRTAGASPTDWSPAQARDVIRRAMRHALGNAPNRDGKTLRQQLGMALRDKSTRRGPKETRTWPRKKEQRPPNPPKFQVATRFERQRAQQLWRGAQLRL